MNHRGVAQYAHLGVRTILVSQTDGVADDFSKVGMCRRFTVAGKRQYVRQFLLFHHQGELFLQCFCYFFTGRAGQTWTKVFVETTFTIDTVKRANLPVGWHQVDTQ